MEIYVSLSENVYSAELLDLPSWNASQLCNACSLDKPKHIVV